MKSLGETPFRVLIVEDDISQARLVQHLLGSMEFVTQVASDGRRGLAAFHEFVPHLVLLDLMIPVMDGRQVLRAIRRESTVPIMIFSALDEEDAGLASFRNGADDYLTKPYDPALLLARVVAHLRRAYGYDSPQPAHRAVYVN